MLGWLRDRARLRRNGHELYERIVAMARRSEIYSECRVPDTMDGRLEMILLHVVLVLDRLKREGEAGQRLGQRLMESLVADLDDALRQIGLGDDSVSGRIQKLAGALTERAHDYGLALDGDYRNEAPDEAGSAALAAALAEHVYRRGRDAPVETMADARRLAAHVRRTRSELSRVRGTDLLAARLVRDAPERVATQATEPHAGST